MKNTCPLYIIFQVLKVLLIKICKSHQSHQIFYLLLHAFISFCILHQHNRYSFFRKFLIFDNFIQHFLTKNIFVTNFPFLMTSLSPLPHFSDPPLSQPNLLSVTKVFCWYSVIYIYILSMFLTDRFYQYQRGLIKIKLKNGSGVANVMWNKKLCMRMAWLMHGDVEIFYILLLVYIFQIAKGDY